MNILPSDVDKLRHLKAQLILIRDDVQQQALHIRETGGEELLLIEWEEQFTLLFDDVVQRLNHSCLQLDRGLDFWSGVCFTGGQRLIL
jgi:hypothetical protein